MNTMPEEIKNAWEHHEGPIVFSTVDKRGIPNSIYATCVSLSDDGGIVIADNYFMKTRENLQGGSSGSVLFMTAEGTSYQVKGPIEYHGSGPYHAFMKSWNPRKHPGHAATVLRPEQFFQGSRAIPAL